MNRLAIALSLLVVLSVTSHTTRAQTNSPAAALEAAETNVVTNAGEPEVEPYVPAKKTKVRTTRLNSPVDLAMRRAEAKSRKTTAHSSPSAELDAELTEKPSASEAVSESEPAAGEISETNAVTGRSKGPVYLHVISHPENEQAHKIVVEPSFTSRTEGLLKDFFGIGKVDHLFNGKDLESFYPWLSDSGVYVDRDQVFSVEDGLLHITGQHQGFIATKTEFSDYRLIAEYKWGKQEWYKHKETPRNSGIFINASGQDGMDMRSLEVQIMEGDTGAIVLHGGASLTVGKETRRKPWSEFKNPEVSKVEKPTDWNKLEIISEGNRIRVVLNGQVTIDGCNATPTRGKIFVQSNGAEIMFRRLDLYHLNQTNTLPLIPISTGAH